MDILDVPNLRTKALAFLGAVLWRRAPTVRNPRLQRIFGGYGALALLYTQFVAVSTLLAYHRYVQGLMAHILPAILAAILGWAVAGALSWLVLARAWADVRRGARQAGRAGVPAAAR